MSQFNNNKNELLKKLKTEFNNLKATEKKTLKWMADLAVQTWKEILPTIRVDENSLRISVLKTIDDYINKNKGVAVSPDTLILLILNAMKHEFTKISKKTDKVLEPPKDITDKLKPKISPKKSPPKSTPDGLTIDDLESVGHTTRSEMSESEHEITEKPKSDEFTDLDDPRTISYKDVDLKLKPKRGSYKLWENLVKFNAHKHFEDRYKKAYAYHHDTEPRDTSHDKLHRLAQSTVYKTLTEPQYADYVDRVSYYNQDAKSFPENPPKPYKWDKNTNIWRERRKYLDHTIDTPAKAEEQTRERHLQIKKKASDALEDIASDFSGYSQISTDEYESLRDSVKSDLSESYISKIPESLKGEERRAREKRDYDQLEEATDNALRKNHLKYALKKPYTRWYQAFISNLKDQFPHRYEAILKKQGLDGFRQSSRARTETLRTFNQKQLDEWLERVKHETELMGNDSYLPKNGTLTSPNYNKDLRASIMGGVTTPPLPPPE